MPFHNDRGRVNIFSTLCACAILMLLFTSCASPASSIISESTQNNYPQTEVIFKVTLQKALPENTRLALEVVDDVTGLAFNPQRFEMTQQDALDYFVKLDLVIGSTLKYRYIRLSDMNAIEYTPQGNPVRFRIADISRPAIFQDNIAAWIDQPYHGAIGRVRGQFTDDKTNQPIPNLLVTAEGIQTITASDGTFTVEGVTPGTHNFVVYSMDGKYGTFQQGVLVSDEATTPVFIALTKRATVNVTFEVSAPDDFDASIPMRFASNLQNLGNLYSDLGSGSATVASRLPVMTLEKTGKYSITMELPIGLDLHYKYTLGDGLWNSELTNEGKFVVRELIVRNKTAAVSNTIATFRSPNLQPITFDVTAPKITPSTDSVSIQFNPFGWFEPLPMVKKHNNQWTYTLYSPLHLLGPVEYRFCRNELCELSSSNALTNQVFQPASTPQSFAVNISNWNNYQGPLQVDLTTNGGDLAPRTSFLAGFELTAGYSPNAEPYLDTGFENLANEAANTLIIPSTWTATRNNPPYLEPLPGIDYSWDEMQTTITKAKQQGLQVILFPMVRYQNSAATFWSSAKRDEGWWITWYENYHRYIMQTADWAAANGVSAIIIGDPSVSPAFGNGKLADGKSSGSPDNADAQWRQLISDIRARYSGMVIGAWAYPNATSNPPGWLDSADAIYTLYTPPLAQVSSISTDDLMTIIKNDLEGNLNPKLSRFGKSILLGINYPSASNAFGGCSDILGSCLSNWGNAQTDLLVQSQIYNAAVIVAAKEPWVKGFFSRNYQPVAAVQDSSCSINGKPAFDVLWFWYHYILNKSS